MRNVLLRSALLFLCLADVYGQSGQQYRRFGIHNGNQVRTVFGNWGVIGQPRDKGPRGSWKRDNNGYLGDVSLLVGAEVKYSDSVNYGGVWVRRDTVFRSVVTCPVDRPTALRDESPSGKPWAFEPVGGYLNANQERIAMSTDPESWPQTWPDKFGDANDPGWPNSWNGYFGKFASATQESYFVMDDNNDQRFSFAASNVGRIAFRPDPSNSSKYGLGLEVRVRGMQWSNFLAKDNIFWLYEITNTGATTYDRVVFGMLVGTYVGVTGSSDAGNEWDDDWSFYDVNTNITYTGDFDRSAARNALWQGPVGMVGYAFLESPGNPFDGIDNDADADSVALSLGVPKFVGTSFDSTVIMPGSQIVLINDDFLRTLFVVPNDTVTVYTRGKRIFIEPGVTKVAEGDILLDLAGNPYVNPNAYDGIDNDLDGLIDENFYLHYRQIKQTRTVPPKTLIDVLRPVRYKNYVAGFGLSPLSMIDERRNDLIDNNGNWDVAFDDLGRDGIADTKDFGEGDGQPTSGYDALGRDTGLPGEPKVDKTDVRESDQIGLTSFYYFTPANNIRLGDDNSLWSNLAPGFFDVPTSIVQNRPERGEDGDFVYGSGYFPLLTQSTERFSLALVYGGGKGGTVDDDINDLLKNKKTVQDIYDNNYQFEPPPDPPTLTVVPGDRQVTLYWDRKAEESVDPILRRKDFEGYKIYRSTDPDFSDIFNITDASGSPQGYIPIAQFDLKNGISGLYRANEAIFQDVGGYTFDLGSDNGLVHSYVDKGLENGRRYFYAVVAYDRGDEAAGVFPAENSKFVTILTTGEIKTGRNVAVAVPNKPVSGYQPPEASVGLKKIQAVGTGSISYYVVDQRKTTGDTYRVSFWDSLIDTVDNDKNGKKDNADTLEWLRKTSFYAVENMSTLSENFVIQDSISVTLDKKNIIGTTVTIKNASGQVVSPTAYSIDTTFGVIRPLNSAQFPSGEYTITFRHYPVYRSPHIKGSPYELETKDAEEFDGVMLDFTNDWSVAVMGSQSGWVDSLGKLNDKRNPYVWDIYPTNFPDLGLLGYRRPADYMFVFDTTVMRYSMAVPSLGIDSIPCYFRLYNTTDNREVDFIYADFDWATGNIGGKGYGKISPLDELILMEPSPTGDIAPTWDIFFIQKVGDPADTVYTLTNRDTLYVRLSKAFRQGDLFEFATQKPTYSPEIAKTQLNNVRVVPNPYVTATAHELPLPPGITSGRGQRKIDFISLPPGAKVHIFTSRGDHVITLQHDGSIESGVLSWNLKSKENLDIAYGVYFYVVESAVGNKTGKLAVIK